MSPRTRANGEGSISKIKSGRHAGKYLARLTLGWEDGQQVRAVYMNTRRADCVAWLERARADRDAGLPVSPDRQTVRQYLEYWLTEAYKPAVKLSSYVRAENIVSVHINEALGDKKLSGLTPQDVQTFLNTLAAKGLASATRKRIYAVLSKALEQALRWGLIARNPARMVDPPRLTAASEVHPFTISEARRLLEAVRGHRLEALYTVALSLGLRRGEALGLMWDDIDFDRSELHVRHTLQRLAGRLHVDTPKSHQARTVSLPAFALSALRAHRQRQLEERLRKGEGWQDTGHVFCSNRGTPIEPRNYNRHFYSVLEAAGLPRLRVHDLRHTAATLMRAQGVDMKMISRTLGHSKVAITADLYSHLYDDEARDAADRMDRLLGGNA